MAPAVADVERVAVAIARKGRLGRRWCAQDGAYHRARVQGVAQGAGGVLVEDRFQAYQLGRSAAVRERRDQSPWISAASSMVATASSRSHAGASTGRPCRIQSKK